MTWIVFLDKQGKWHCYSEGWGKPNSYSDANARKMAQALVGQLDGTADFIDSAAIAYCIHASSRSRAISIAKKAHKATLLKVAVNV